MTRLPIITVMLLVAVACSPIPERAHYMSSSPDQLLDITSEVVTIPVQTTDGADELIEWLNEDEPTRVELYCDNQGPYCDIARDILEQFGIAYTAYVDPQNEAALIYERVLARDCDGRDYPNHINPYNLPYPNIGCSVAANSLQMISDKTQIIAPALSGYANADKVVSGAMTIYRQPPTNEVLTFDTEFNQ